MTGQKIRARLKELGIKQKTIQHELHISERTLHYRLTDTHAFTEDERKYLNRRLKIARSERKEFWGE